MDLDRLRRLAEILSHKWDLVILGCLAERPLRYMEIASQVRESDSDLTEGVLSKNLKRLASSGLIRRERRSSYHVYTLTPRGRYIVAILEKINDFDDEMWPPDGPESGQDW